EGIEHPHDLLLHLQRRDGDWKLSKHRFPNRLYCCGHGNPLDKPLEVRLKVVKSKAGIDSIRREADSISALMKSIFSRHIVENLTNPTLARNDDCGFIVFIL